MRLKGFPLFVVCVILTGAPGCDNVRWDGVSVELRSAEPPPREASLDQTEGEHPLEPLELGPLVYLATRDGGEARLLPVAAWRGGRYEELPAAAETPDLVERFPLGRWDRGTEFVLLDAGMRAGILTSDGSVAADSTASCRLRPAGRGRIELRPEAADRQRFLAVRRADLEAGLLPPSLLDVGPVAETSPAGTLRAGALVAGRQVIAEGEIPWPPTIPEILRDQRAIPLGDDQEGMAATFVFGDEPAVGQPSPLAYSLFLLARREEDRWPAFWIWYQRAEDGKAVPRLVGSGDLRGDGVPDLLLEVFGAESRWFAVAGQRDGEWSLLYSDACGTPPRPGAARPWP